MRKFILGSFVIIAPFLCSAQSQPAQSESYGYRFCKEFLGADKILSIAMVNANDVEKSALFLRESNKSINIAMNLFEKVKSKITDKEQKDLLSAMKFIDDRTIQGYFEGADVAKIVIFQKLMENRIGKILPKILN